MEPDKRSVIVVKDLVTFRMIFLLRANQNLNGVQLVSTVTWCVRIATTTCKTKKLGGKDKLTFKHCSILVDPSSNVEVLAGHGLQITMRPSSSL